MKITKKTKVEKDSRTNIKGITVFKMFKFRGIITNGIILYDLVQKKC